MKFATFTHLPWPEENRPGDVYESHTQQVTLAEELGFHSAWIAEHHFTRYGLGFAPLVIAANIMARTSKIRIGTAVLVPSLHHLVRLAEEVPVLDVLSYGRIDVGFGRGADRVTSFGAITWTTARVRSTSVKASGSASAYGPHLDLPTRANTSSWTEPTLFRLPAAAAPAHLHRSHPYSGDPGVRGVHQVSHYSRKCAIHR